MYQYVFGFMVGVYVGTRYDMTEYVDGTEKSVRAFLENIKKKEKPEPQPESKSWMAAFDYFSKENEPK